MESPLAITIVGPMSRFTVLLGCAITLLIEHLFADEKSCNRITVMKHKHLQNRVSKVLIKYY